MPSAFYRLPRHLWSRYGNVDGLIGWVLSMSGAAVGAAIASEAGWSRAVTVLAGLAGCIGFLGAVEAVLFVEDRRGREAWRNALSSWKHWVPLPEDDVQYLYHHSWDNPRDGRVVRKWAHANLSSTLLVALLKAGLTDADLLAYVAAPDGSDTRAALEMLASLSS